MAVDPSMNNDDKKALRRRLNGDMLPTAVVHPSFLQNLTENASQPSGFGGVGTGATPAQYQQGLDAGAHVGAALAAASAPAAAPVQQADNISASNLAAANGLGRRLAPGVSRYALGGDIAGPNATPIYTTRGKNGEAVFTDNADFAAGQSTGGLRRGTVNDAVYNNAQVSANNPRANYEFAQSTLGGKGLQRRDFQNLDSDATQQALALATAGAGGSNPEQALSDRMDANLLRARQVTQQQAAGANTAALDPKTQIALFRAKTAAAQGDERNAIAKQGLVETQRARSVAEKNSDRQDTNDFFTQYNQLKANNDPQMATFLTSAIPQDPKEFDKFATTTRGKRVLQAYLSDVLRPGALNSLEPLELGDKANAPGLRYRDLNIDPQSGFNGFNDASGSNQYPANRGFLRSLKALATPGESFQTNTNYDGSTDSLSPEIWKRLQKLNF